MASFLNRTFAALSPNKAAKEAAAAKNKKPTPAQLLHDLQKNWNYVHQIFFIENAREHIHVSQTEIPVRLREIVDILGKEDQWLQQQQQPASASPKCAQSLVRPLLKSWWHSGEVTGLCMEYLLNNHVMQNLYDHAAADFPRGMLLEVTKTFSQLISELDDRFLVQSGVHVPVLKLLKRGLMGSNPDGEQLDVELAQLMFNMCSKLHERPELLHIFFIERPAGKAPNDMPPGVPRIVSDTISPKLNDAIGIDPEIDLETHEFPLFLYLLRFIAQPGKAGDIARAALSICVEIASGPVNDFIVHRSNFCKSVVSVVGSMYLDLPRSLGLSSAADLAADPRFKMFASILEYCQQILVKAHKSVQRALADEFSTAFLERLVGPQLFGGSSTNEDPAAIALWTTYTELSLRKIDHPLLTWAYGDFLLHDSVYAFVEPGRADAPVPVLLQRLDNPSAAVSQSSWRLLYTLVASRASPAIARLFPSVIYRSLVAGSALATDHTSTESVAVPPATTAAASAMLLSSLARRYITLLPFDDTDIITNGYSDYQHDAETAFEYNLLIVRHLQDVHAGSNVFARGQPPLPAGAFPTAKPAAAAPAASKVSTLSRLSSSDVDTLGLEDDDDEKATPTTAAPPQPSSSDGAAEVAVPAPVPCDDPFKFILLRHLSSLLSAPEEHNLLVTGIVAGLAVFPHPLLFSTLFNVPFSSTDATSIHGTLLQLSRSIARSNPSREAIVGSSNPKAPSKPSDAILAANLMFFEEFIKELAAAVQVQSLEGAERVLFMEQQ